MGAPWQLAQGYIAKKETFSQTRAQLITNLDQSFPIGPVMQILPDLGIWLALNYAIACSLPSCQDIQVPEGSTANVSL